MYKDLILRRFYKTWINIPYRCNKPNAFGYKRYGGRGIKNEWKSFEEFKNDMYKSYLIHLKKFGKKNTTIDRIDNNGNYCKENCRWATRKEQARNTKQNINITFQNKTYCLGKWAEITGIKASILWNRLKQSNWSIEKTFLTPVRSRQHFKSQKSSSKNFLSEEHIL